MPDAVYLAFLLVDGALAGALYALVALAFVVVYKASRMINFAMGEWIMLGVAHGRPPALTRFGLGLAGALGVGCVGTGRGGARIQPDRPAPTAQPSSLLSLIMVTIGARHFHARRGGPGLRRHPRRDREPLPLEPFAVLGMPILGRQARRRR